MATPGRGRAGPTKPVLGPLQRLQAAAPTGPAITGGAFLLLGQRGNSPVLPVDQHSLTLQTMKRYQRIQN